METAYPALSKVINIASFSVCSLVFSILIGFEVARGCILPTFV